MSENNMPPSPGKSSLPENDSVKDLPKVEEKIKVVATRAGFYKQRRKAEGDIFFIENMKQLGSWMRKV